MKIVENTKKKFKKNQVDLPNKEHVLIVAQEIKFARLLSGNEKKSRDRVLKTLKKWLINCFQKGYEFKEDDFIRVWKGLFYAVWMSDKPLVQEDLCESIAGILDQFPKEQFQNCLLMVKGGFKVLATEWYGIDHHRMDKYLMLVRRYLRGSLRCLYKTGWSVESCQMYSNVLASSDGLLALKTPHYARNAMSMVLHIIECYLEELSKVSDGDIPADSLVELLRPFCAYMSNGEVMTVCIACRRLLTALMRQSEPGLRYGDATDAWKRMGCPQGGPEALELVTDDAGIDDGIENGDADMPEDNFDESDEKPLDPRAGRVDVVLHPLPVPAAKIADVLREMLAQTSSKAHRRVKICMQRFEKLASNEYPLPIPRSEAVRDYGPRISAQRSAKALRALEKNLAESSDELALRGLNRRHRKRLLAKARSGASIVEDVDKIKQSITNTTNGDWQVEATEPEPKKAKHDTSGDAREVKRNRKNKKSDKDKKIRKRKVTTSTATDTEVVASKKPQNAVKILKPTVKPVATSIKTNVTFTNGESKRIKNNTEVKRKATKDVTKTLNHKVVDEKIREKVKLNNSNQEHKKGDENKEKKLQKDIRKLTRTEKPVQIMQNIKDRRPTLIVNKVKKFQKPVKTTESSKGLGGSPKRVKFVLKNNSMQGPVDYYKSVRQSPSIPFDSHKTPNKTNLKPSTPSPINPFFKQKKRNRT